MSTEIDESIEKVAVIGMAGRFPGAENIETFWQNLQAGVDSISTFSDRELLAEGVDPTWLDLPSYVKAGGVLEDIDLFDAGFFEFSPKEAEITDPQHRLFLESAYVAIEDAGYDLQRCTSRVGVYAGASLSNYLALNCDRFGSATSYQALIGNDKDFLTTRVAYKLNLKGPCITVQTACSTSLVAVALACQSLLSYQCDMALAGGVSVRTPQKTGYFSEVGGTLSPDGRCCAFDASAKGTVVGNGVGVVVLKRLQEAIADRDHIYATISGTAINNDGAGKVGYTAPSVDGQGEVITEAMMLAGVNPETISYVEAHGTGTALGDPIEIAALSQAFRTDKTGFCAIGSVKTNIGHLDAASGITGLIKTALALKYKLIPPSLNFQQPNPQIDFANSPFYVNTKLKEWQTSPRRAGVSSLGMGGTNAHVLLEEAPIQVEKVQKKHHLLVLSAKTTSALESATRNLGNYLQQHPQENLADVAYTLQVGRREFDYRRILVCRDIDDALSQLGSKLTHNQVTGDRLITFMFPGQGSQYADMGKELYVSEPVFRQQVDRCCEILKPYLGLDLRSLFGSTEQLKQTPIAQTALFVVEYALAALWMSWGINPESAIGHSIGEYVAACLAGVLSLEDALKLVAVRGQLMQQCPTGSMLAVSLPQTEVTALLSDRLSLAAINAPSSCVVAGTDDAIDSLQAKLQTQGISCRRLHVSHAFHSPLMDEILEPFRQEVALVKLHPPKIPFISNVTGTWITAQEATDPNYWVKHLRHTVCFSSGIAELLQAPNRILLEVGAGRTLSTFAKQHSEQRIILSSLPHPQEKQSDIACLLHSLGSLWLSGVAIDWTGFYGENRPQRIPLPTYPFERQRYWRDRPVVRSFGQAVVEASQREIAIGDRQTHIQHKNRLEYLCTAYMNLALRDLGRCKDPFAKEELLAQVVPRYRQLLHRWLEVLVERGHLQQDGNLYNNLLPLSPTAINDLVAEAITQHPGYQQQLELIQTCGENLAAVLVGTKEPLELHFATLVKNGAISRANLPADDYYNSILRTSLEQVVKSLPPEANLRILEIGGGTGIATAEILPLLPPERTKYTFTDVGSFFLDAAKQRFSNYPFVEYRTLDIEKPLTEQGFSLQSFDVVIAVNVLHVTQNLADTLERVHSLLTPDGLLLMQEITQPQLEFDITDGLLMHPLEDVQRSQGNPFLSKEQWQELLSERAFNKVVAYGDADFGQHIFIAHASLSQKKDIADWFYIPSWQRSLQPLDTDNQKQCWLIFLDDRGLGDRLVEQLQLQGHDIVTVKVGTEFSSIGDRAYTLNPQQKSGYNTLIQALAAKNLLPSAIAHLWNITDICELTTAEVSQAQTRGFYSLLFLTQALVAQNCDSLQIKVISNNMQAVNVNESLCPQKATVVGLVKVIAQEYSHIRCCSIDVTLPAPDSWQAEKLTDKLLRELTATSTDKVVAYRGGYRWLQNFLPVSLPTSTLPKLKQGGVYLIIGGLGSLGLVLAEYLAKTYQAKLILVGRSAVPSPEDCKHKKLLELEALGAEVITFSADTANLEQMQNAIALAETRFGRIDGVIHCVATNITERMRRIEQLSQVECDREFQAKVYGILVLQQVLQGLQLDFCLVVSSLASIFGGVGHAAYSAANLFLDAFVCQHNQTNPVPWTSINWDGRVPFLPGLNVNPELTMTPQDDIEVFKRVLAGEDGQIVVSTRNLQTRIDTWTNQAPTNSSGHSGSNLQTNYIAPRDRLEQDIADIWQEVLGISQIGIHDNFFELGGDSLTGVTIINKFQQLNYNIAISALFEAPTIAELVTHFPQKSLTPVLASKSNREEGEV